MHSNKVTELQISQSVSRQHLKKLGEFILNVAGEHILWVANDDEPTFVKTIFLRTVRSQLPFNVKEAIRHSKINPSLHNTYDDIKNITLKLKMPNGSNSFIKFSKVYSTYFLNNALINQSKTHHKSGEPFTYFEKMEKSARNASTVNVGNCSECSNICMMAWLECNKTALEKLKLPSELFSSIALERVHFTQIDHTFTIANRPANARLSDMTSWIINGHAVIIIDFWLTNGEVISVNEQLALSPEMRNPQFEWIRNEVEKDSASIFVDYKAKLGEGHSLRWKTKGRDDYYFLQEDSLFAVDDVMDKPSDQPSKQLNESDEASIITMLSQDSKAPFLKDGDFLKSEENISIGKNLFSISDILSPVVSNRNGQSRYATRDEPYPATRDEKESYRPVYRHR